jgi:hypothetical protein
LAEVVLVDERVLLPDLLFIRTAAALQKGLLCIAIGTLLDGVEKVVALATELHCISLVVMA